MFKITKKQKSAPKPIKIGSNQAIQQFNRYRCLKEISDTEQHWKRLVQNQLEMAPTIVAFQNVQISMRVDAHKKLMLRETFMLKKQIIRLILNEKYDEILQKLEILRKTSPADNILASLFMDFYRIRQQIQLYKLQYCNATVTKIKQKILEYHDKIQRQKGSIIFGRILYIAALHLIKLDGVLIRNQDIGIIVQALNSKKKQLCMLTSEINKVTLESLLFLTFEFYKILYLLKRDQDLMTQYYNQIQAYISIYRTKCKNFQQFEKNFKIAEKIQKMQPLNFNLKIYDDHDRRRILSLQNTKQQLMKNHFANRNGNIIISQINAQMTSNNRKTLNRINSIESSFEKQEQSQSKITGSESLIAKDISNYALKGGLEQTKLNQKTRFCFQFIKPDEPYLFNGKFQVQFSQDTGQLRILITILKKEQVVGLFQLNQTGTEKKRNLGQCAKKLWRIIKQTFYTDKTQFLPNLFSFEYPPFHDLPKNVNKTFELPILVRIHQILLHHLRKQSETRKMTGQLILFPNPKAQNEKKLNDPSQAEYKIFAKRHGFISFNKKIRGTRHKTTYHSPDQIQQQQQDQQLYIVLIIKQDSQYCIVSANLSQSGIKYFLSMNRNLKMVGNNRNQYSIKDNLIKEYGMSWGVWRTKRVSEILKNMQDCKSGQDYFVIDHQCVQRKFQSSIEEQFEVMKSPVLQTRYKEIKDYKRQRKISRMKHLGRRNQVNYEIIKISGKYCLFFTQQFQTHTRYYDSKIQFIMSSQLVKDYEIVYKKYRLFKTVLLKKRTEANEWAQKEGSKEQYMKIYCVKSKDGQDKQEIKIKQQRIQVQWKRSCIGKKANQNGYIFVNLYEWRQHAIVAVYDFPNFKKYMAHVQQNDNLLNCKKWVFDQHSQMLNHQIQMKNLEGNRYSICEAQQFLQMTLSPSEKIETP